MKNLTITGPMPFEKPDSEHKPNNLPLSMHGLIDNFLIEKSLSNQLYC